uniref:Uncharacterized protein n=1 Tax=Fundulus heteroclitus TaxID=8078 RepID=A0A3Q2QN83_FUNHE
SRPVNAGDRHQQPPRPHEGLSGSENGWIVCSLLCGAIKEFLSYSHLIWMLLNNKLQLQTVKDRFQAFLNGETQIVTDEAFINAVQSYYEIFLKSDRVSRMVQSGGFSASDSREVFKKHIEKRVRSLPEIDGLSKETVLSSWIAKFDTIYREKTILNRRHEG